MKFFADLHLHSKYELSASPQMSLLHIDEFASKKGIRLVGTGDCMYPEYLNELKKGLTEVSDGMFESKNVSYGTRFMLTTEVNCSCIWNDHNRKVHMLILFPSFEAVEKVYKVLKIFGEVKAQPRPTYILAPKFLVQYVKETVPECEIIPAHVMTPWYGLLGSRHGYDSVEEAFEEHTQDLLALETGLSADLDMVSQITGDQFSLVSFGDAHSLHKIGREVTAFNCDLDYPSLIKDIRDKLQLFTIEFYPQMGKYYLSGHRDCNTSLLPEDAHGVNKCPTCGRRFVQGVAYRVWRLRKYGGSQFKLPSTYAVPLKEIIAVANSSLRATKKSKHNWNRKKDFSVIRKDTKTGAIYESIIRSSRPEISILLNYSRESMEEYIDTHIINAIMQARRGELTITPGYDGLYGEIKFDSQRV
jgi:PHP family Zn ribbon phosphoesterase